MDQLWEAKHLALEREPATSLPRVLETTQSMIQQNIKDVDPIMGNFFNELLLDTMNHPAISQHEKPLIAAQHVNLLSQLLLVDACKQSTILVFTKVYPMLFDLVAKTSNDGYWTICQNMKKYIFQQWKLFTITDQPLNLNDDTKQIALKLAIIKFISQVIITYTPNESDNVNSISINIIPMNHPVISNKNKLESEGKIMLDVIINYLIEEPMMVSSVFIGIIHCLSTIIKQRSQFTLRILNGVLKFNVDGKYQTGEMTTLNFRLSKRFVERCYKNFIQFCIKNQFISKNNSNTVNYYNKLSKIAQTLFIIGEETKSKGILQFDEQADSHKLNDADRDKIIQYRVRKKSKTDSNGAPGNNNDNHNNNNLNTNTNKNVNTNINNSNDNLNQSSNASPPPPVNALPPNAMFAYANNGLPNGNGMFNNTVTPSVNNSNSPMPTSHTDPKIKEFLIDLQTYTNTKSTVTNFPNPSPIANGNEYKSIFSLMNQDCSQMNLAQLPQDILIKLISESLYKADTKRMIAALSIVASRYTAIMQSKTVANTSDSNTEVKQEANDVKMETKTSNESNVRSANESIENNNNNEEPPKKKIKKEKDVKEKDKIDQSKLKPYFFEPKSIEPDAKIKLVENIVNNLFQISESKNSLISANSMANDTKTQPLNQIKLINWSPNESWYQILIRLATRGCRHNETISNLIREQILKYVMNNIIQHMNVMIEWMNEEWFADKIFAHSSGESTQYYHSWSIRLLDELIPFLENKHRKIFIRLMSELPSLNQEHLEKMKPLLLDPSRSTLGFQSIKFMLMFRAPVKSLIKPILEELSAQDETLKTQCEGILHKFYK